MKLAFIADNDLAGVERDAAFAEQHGFAGLEFNYWGGFKDLTADAIGRMRGTLDKHGIGCSMFGLWGWNHLSTNPTERAEAHAMLDRAIGFAPTLGADVFVTGAGDMPGEPVGRKIKEFLRVFPPMLDKVRAAGMKPAFYAVHGASFLDSIGTLERVWEDVPDLRLKFDPANWRHDGVDYIDLLRRWGHKVGYVHVKEHLYHDGKVISEPPAGMGDIAWGKVLALLYEHHYDGWLSIEPHGHRWGRPPLREKTLLIGKRHLEPFLI